MPRTAKNCLEIAQRTVPRLNNLRKLLDEGELSPGEMVKLIERRFPEALSYQRIFCDLLGVGISQERLTIDQAFANRLGLPNLSRHAFDKIVGNDSITKLLGLLRTNDPDVNPLLERPSEDELKAAGEEIAEVGSTFVSWCRRMSQLASHCPARLPKGGAIGAALREIVEAASKGRDSHAFFIGPLVHRGAQKWIEQLEEGLPSFGLNVARAQNPTANGLMLIVSW